MANFIVLDVSEERRRVALQDREGRYHVARAMAELPEVGAYLDGAYAAEGPSMLVALRTGQVYRLLVEALNCGQLETFDRLHSDAIPELGRPASGPPDCFVATRTTDTWDSVLEAGVKRS